MAELTKKGKCTNYSVGNQKGCPKADANEIIEVDVIDDFVCPHCHSELMEIPDKKGPKVPGWIWAVAAVLVLGGAGGYFALGYSKSEPVVEGPEEPAIEEPAIEESVVEEPVDSTVYVSTIKTDKEAYTLTEGKEIAIDAAVEPEDATDPSLVWSSSDETVATVADGTVKGVKAGKTTVTIRSNDGKASASVEVTVSKPVERPAGPTCGTFSGRLKNGYPHGTGTLTFKVSRRIDSHDQQNRMAQPGDYLIGEWDNGHLIQARWYDASNNLKETIVLGKAMNPEQDHALGKFGK